jgi:putative ABC transport system permease protein
MVRYYDRMLHDLRHAVRGLLRSPAFTVISVLTLALGIGANTAVLSLARAVFINPLPFKDADRLVAIAERRAGSRDTNIPVSGHEFAAWKDENQVFEQMAISRGAAFNLTGAGEPETIQAVLVSVSYLPTVGLSPALGRAFVDGEDAAGRNRVVILSDGLWRRRFGGDPNIVSRPITLDGQSFSVVGVMGPLPPSIVPDVLLPLDMEEHLLAVGRHNLNVLARLGPTVTIDAARSNVAAISERLATTMPRANTGHTVAVTPLRELMVGEFRRASWLMIAAVGFVLLIGCANVANLLLARGANRQREIAIRTALGAGRARVVRQLTVESLVLAVVSGAVGLLISAWILDLAPKIAAVNIPLLETARLGSSGLAMAAAISLLTGLAAGLVPAFRSSRVHPGWLREGNRMSDDPERRRLRNALVACEVGLTLVLLVGAGLMINSFVRLTSVDPGFRTAGVLVVPVDLPPSRYPEAYQRRDFYDRVIGTVEGIPGVDAAGAVSHLPLGGADNWMPFRVAGRPDPPAGQEPYAPFRVATPDYFKTLQIPLRRGRIFDQGDARPSMPIIRWFPQQPYPAGHDQPQPAPVAVVSEAAARQFWPGGDPIGQRIRVLFSPEVTIIGIAGDVRHNGLNLPAYPHIYLSHNQEPWNSVSLVVRSSLPVERLTPAIRQRVREADPSLPITVRRMEDVLSASVGQPRLYAAITGLFGVVALLLAVVGIVGVVSYVAAQRTREIGVRMALGAQRREILALVVGQGMRPIAVGIGAGVVAAVGVTRFMTKLLFQVAPLDLMTFALVTLILTGVAFLACWIPARRATQVDPVTSLRAE